MCRLHETGQIDLPFVQPVKARGCLYYYFRRGRIRFALSGRLGSRELQDSYNGALRQHAPHLLQQPKRAARVAQHKRDAMYDTEVLEAAINAAGNVKRLRSA